MEAKTGDARAWEILASAERFATHDPAVAWPDGPHDNAVDAIMDAFDAEREQRGNAWGLPGTPLMRAIQCARTLRGFTVAQRDGGEQPFTLPVLEFSSDDSVAEIEVTHHWGFGQDELKLFVDVAETYRGELTIFRHREKESLICASFRFIE